ncbi:MAG: NUDIX domain-containing protein [Hyphomonas sp.]
MAGSVVTRDDKILLCRRAIEPRKGFWTLPAGFMEENETVEDAARREAQEEACADIRISQLLAVYSVPRISQVQVMFRASLASDIAAGPESLEVGLFAWKDIPWSELAFPTVIWALTHYSGTRHLRGFPPFTNPPGTESLTR